MRSWEDEWTILLLCLDGWWGFGGGRVISLSLVARSSFAESSAGAVTRSRASDMHSAGKGNVGMTAATLSLATVTAMANSISRYYQHCTCTISLRIGQKKRTS